VTPLAKLAGFAALFGGAALLGGVLDPEAAGEDKPMAGHGDAPAAAHGDEAGHDDSVGFEVTFPSEGRYRLFVQFKHVGRVQTVAFTQAVQR
jgi:hypothetical protein